MTTPTWAQMTQEGGPATPNNRIVIGEAGNAMGSLMAQSQAMAQDISGSSVSLLNTPAPDKGKGGRIL
jgi:hypothetical protein